MSLDFLSSRAEKAKQKVCTGISGFDDLLGGGFKKNRLYLIQGDPGSGKTTVALQFLLDGTRRGESTLCISVSESLDEITDTCDSFGWSLEGIEFYNVSAVESEIAREDYTVFHHREVELGAAVKRIMDTVKRVRPSRVVFDSVSELRLLASDTLRFRQQIAALKRFFGLQECTVLLLDDETEGDASLQLQTLCNGVILLKSEITDYGAPQRKLRVIKMRGVDVGRSETDFEIGASGARLFDHSITKTKGSAAPRLPVKSGILELDLLFGGGPLQGTSTLLIGPSGCGKSSVASAYAEAAASRGEKTAFYIFEEGLETFQRRVDKMGGTFARHMASGLISVVPMNLSELTVGKFGDQLRELVRSGGVTTVIIDSLNGYLHTMVGEKQLLLQLHELLAHLGAMRVNTFLTVSQLGAAGNAVRSEMEVSYLSDSVLLFRFFETGGRLRRALSVVKKRDGAHEDTVRELSFTDHDLKVGEPIVNFQAGVSGSLMTSNAFGGQ